VFGGYGCAGGDDAKKANAEGSPRVVRCEVDAGRRFDHPHAEFLTKLPVRRLGEGLARVDLSAGKFPEAAMALVSRTAPDQYAAPRIGHHARHDVADVALGIAGREVRFGVHVHHGGNMPVRQVDDHDRAQVAAGRDTEVQVLIGPEEGPNFALRRFIIQPGGGMPLHTNLVEHEQYVLRGCASVVIGEETHEVTARDVVYIPAGVPHSYDAEGDEPFEFLCVVPNAEDRVDIVDAEAC